MSLIYRILKKIIYLLMSNKRIGLAFMNAAIDLRPDEVIKIAIDKNSKRVIDRLLDNHEVKVIEAVSFNVAIDYFVTNHKTALIQAINECGDGAFRYVGNGEIKIILGAGLQEMPGWLATDINLLNIVEKSAWHRLFSQNSIDNILAEHVFEHLTLEELFEALANIRNYLKPGGRLRLAVPDAFHPSKYYYNLVKPAGWETPAEHKLFFDCEMITRIVRQSGFDIELIEYFDEKGIFHRREYDHNHGFIQRCASNNSGLDVEDPVIMDKFYSSIPDHLRQQFYDQKMTYTSLIVDLIK